MAVDNFFPRVAHSASRFRHGAGKVLPAIVLAFAMGGVSSAAVKVLDASTTLDSQIPMAGMNPTGVIASDQFVFVLQKRYNRIAVYQRKSPYALVSSFGTSGTGEGQFSQPYGMALDPTGNRIAVADFGNHRVQTFTFNASSGALTYEASLGSKTAASLIGTSSAENGTFAGPRGVSFCADGSLLVADAGNFRVQHFSGSSGSWSHAATYYVNGSSSAPDTLAVLNDVCYDTLNGTEGFWVSDGHKDKYTVSFYPFSETASLTVGLSSDALCYPVGMTPWKAGDVDALLIADQNKSRIAVVDKATGEITDAIGDKSADKALEKYEQVYQPYALFADVERGVLYVADYGVMQTQRINWYGLSQVEDVTYTVSVSPGEGGAASASSTTVVEGGSVTLTATPADGYVFESWTIEGASPDDLTANPLTIASVSADITATANFAVEEDETEEIRWGISGVHYNGESSPPVFVITWSFDLDEDYEATFRIDHSADLATWTENVLDVTVSGAAGSNTGTAEIDLTSGFIQEKANFFRLWWTNHPVE